MSLLKEFYEFASSNKIQAKKRQDGKRTSIGNPELKYYYLLVHDEHPMLLKALELNKKEIICGEWLHGHEYDELINFIENSI